jgi:hypothetical protein
MDGPVKLAIRQDEAAGVIRAYLSSPDDTQREEVATLDLGLARLDPDVFERWTACLTFAVTRLLEEAGIPVLRFEERKPADGQRN